MKRCGMCGSRKITIKNVKGKIIPYGDTKILLTSSYFARTCDNCGNLILSNKDVNQIDKLLKEEKSQK